MHSLSWNDKINDYEANDIKRCFANLMFYRKKSYPKKNINQFELEKIIISAIFDMDACNIIDVGDCYVYYKNILSVYGSIYIQEYKMNLIKLIVSFFNNNGGEIIAEFMENSEFEYFDKVMWSSYVLKKLDKLTDSNIRLVLGKNYKEKINFSNNYDNLVDIVSIIEKKDKKLFISMKDKAEKWILQSGIQLIKKNKGYYELIMENPSSYICIIEGLKEILKDINLEGVPKIYKYSLENLKKIQRALTNVSGTTSSILSNIVFFIL